MKKIIGIIISLGITLSLTACGEKDTPDKKDSNESKNPVNQEQNQKPEKETKSYSIKIDGEEYVFPMSYEKFKSYGWTYYEPESDDLSQWVTTLRPNVNMFLDYSKGDIKCLEINFYNTGDEEVTLDKCQVIGFAVEYGRTLNGDDAEKLMSIPKGSISINEKVVIGEADRKTANDTFEIEMSMDADGYMLTTDDEMLHIWFDENGLFDETSYWHNPK